MSNKWNATTLMMEQRAAKEGSGPAPQFRLQLKQSHGLYYRTQPRADGRRERAVLSGTDLSKKGTHSDVVQFNLTERGLRIVAPGHEGALQLRVLATASAEVQQGDSDDVVWAAQNVHQMQ